MDEEKEKERGRRRERERKNKKGTTWKLIYFKKYMNIDIQENMLKNSNIKLITCSTEETFKNRR